MAQEKIDVLGISHVAFQPHLIITQPAYPGTSVILRIPEYVRGLRPDQKQNPKDVAWEIVAPDRHLRYRWNARDQEKADFGADFWGEAQSAEGEVAFEVTMRNLADEPNASGVSLFCLQAGGASGFHDFGGERTFVRCGDAWRTVAETIEGRWADHRMCGFHLGAAGGEPGTVTERLMVKESLGLEMALGIALDRCESLSCNHKIWPSCIHANPAWGALAPGEERTVRGKVYYVTGSKDDVLARYRRDFCEA